MPNILHYQFDENGVCVGVSELHCVMEKPDVRADKEVKKLTRRDRENADDKYGRRRQGRGWRKNREAGFDVSKFTRIIGA